MLVDSGEVKRRFAQVDAVDGAAVRNDTHGHSPTVSGTSVPPSGRGEPSY